MDIGYNRSYYSAYCPRADTAVHNQSSRLDSYVAVQSDSGDCERHTKGGKEKAEASGRFPAESGTGKPAESKQAEVLKCFFNGSLPVRGDKRQCRRGDMPLSALK